MNIQKKYNIFSSISIPFQCAPIATVIAILMAISKNIVPLLQVTVTAGFIDAAISTVTGKTTFSMMLPYMFGVAALVGLDWILSPWQLAGLPMVWIQGRIGEKFRSALLMKKAKLKFYHIEKSDTWDLIERVFDTPEEKIKDAFELLISLLTVLIQVFGLVTMLYLKVWWAAIVLLFSMIPIFVMSLNSGKANYQAKVDIGKQKRKYTYLSQILSNREAVNERTIFGFGPKLNEQWHESYETSRKMILSTRIKWYIKEVGASVLTSIFSILVTLVLLEPTISGKLSIGLYISLIYAFRELFNIVSWQLNYFIRRLVESNMYLKDISVFCKLEEDSQALEQPLEQPLDFEELVFDNVSFRYPDTQEPILENFNLTIEKGRHYAFVGANGTGKTTITKLITGLYDNYEGQIKINGKPLKAYGQAGIKALSAVVYQDFARYQISIKDNIALGCINTKDNEKKVTEAANIVGLSNVIENLPEKLNTHLGKLEHDGVDLSGGEWQKVAMARAIVNPAPLLILDEPTAALDPISESKIYEEFEKISKNRTTIFISHRLGATKLADRIFVISSGKVAEQGSHEELMKQNGIYAKMYESQRSWYR